MSQRYALLVPVKTLSLAKSRLTSPQGEARAELMRAFAHDVLDAAVACEAAARVYVVTDETGFDDDVVTRLPDEGDGDLNRALVHAAARARTADPDLGVAALFADLPCLTAADLTTALGAGLSPRWFVADAAGTGTALLVAGPGVDLDPHFGVDSARRHEESGAVAVRAGVPTVRRDVDTDDDLTAARTLGVGPHTAAVLARLDLV
jgi:2-phospho-L-lactate/phosphoenolpyruvate guanylyltransferase